MMVHESAKRHWPAEWVGRQPATLPWGRGCRAHCTVSGKAWSKHADQILGLIGPQ